MDHHTRLDQAVLDVPPLPPSVDTVRPETEIHEFALVRERVLDLTWLAPSTHVPCGHAKALDDDPQKPERFGVARGGPRQSAIRRLQLLRLPDRDQRLVEGEWRRPRPLELESNVSIPRPATVGKTVHHGVRLEALVRIEINLPSAGLRTRRQGPEVRSPASTIVLQIDGFPDEAHAVQSACPLGE